MSQKTLSLKTKYMGIELDNPVIVGACSLSKKIDTMREVEDAGAGAMVIKSLFEEQVSLERKDFDDELHQFDELYPEAVNLYPKVVFAEAGQHLYWVAKARKALKMPLIGSLNAITEDVWVNYARQLAETGVDGLELNFYSVPSDETVSGADIEKRELDIFSRIRDAVRIPLSVKLHPYYTNVLHTAREFARRGANALVLFNRFVQPDVNVTEEKETSRWSLSENRELSVPLRFTALLYGRVNADIIASTGIQTGEDVVKALLAGATAVQVVSALYRNKPKHLGVLRTQLEEWMRAKGYSSLQDFRGHVSKKNIKEPWAFERGQYVRALLGFD